MASVRFITTIATLTRTGIVAGVVVAALLYPVVAIGGLSIKRGAEQVTGDLGKLSIAPLSQVTRIFAADGTTQITQFYEEYRIPTTIDLMSTHVQNAIVAAEDSRFYEHNGVDVRGIARAFVANQQAGGVSQGASTITMQYVRMSLRDSAETPTEIYAATERTPTRKIKEIRLAVELEKRLTKAEILERYLNAAYFGHRAYGVRAAAEVYFSKQPAQLTIAESALLAGLVQAPSAYDPAGTDPSAALARRDYVIDRMVALGYVTAAEAEQARAAPIELHLYQPPNDCIDIPQANNDWGFFCDLFKTWWMGRPEYGSNPQERLERLRRGGYTVVTSLDLRAQASAMRQVTSREKTASPYALGLVAVEPGTGRVQSMAVNRVYSLDQSRNGRHSDPARARTGVRGNYPATVNPLLGGGDLPGYQAGSTFKIFTLLAALERGLPLSTTIGSPARYQSRFKTEPGSPTACNGSWWCPVNASKSMTGRQTMWSGFGKSVNTFFVQLEERVGPEAAVRMAERLGLRWHTDIDRLQASPAKARTWGAFTLGVADTTPLEMASAYATIAADGRYCAPLPVLTVAPPGGSSVSSSSPSPSPSPSAGASASSSASAASSAAPAPQPVEPTCTQVVPPDVARAALDAARCVTGYQAATGSCGGWSTAPSVYRTVGRPVAGKTGTTDDNRALWFIGITPSLTTAAFIADPDNPFHEVSSAHRTEPREAVAAMMRETLNGTPPQYFNPPSPAIVGKPTPQKRSRH